MRLIHFTDPHLSSLDGLSFGGVKGKRKTGYLSWTRNRQSFHTRQTLDKLVTAIRAESPDQLILTGDLIQIGLEKEIREVGQWLDELAPAEQIFFVPGNHDVYAKDSWSALRAHWDFILPAKPQEQAESSVSSYPMVRDLGTVRLIGVSSACVTPPFSARGSVGETQLQEVERLLIESRQQRYLPCVAIHHPPLPGMSIWRKALKEAQAFKKLIELHQPALICCGHLHRNIEVIENDTRVYCTASASNSGNASFRIFDIEKQTKNGQDGWAIHMQLKRLSQSNGRFETAQEKHWRFNF
jgi:3',5'-cyclic AMP phosphodiesterase CpdA